MGRSFADPLPRMCSCNYMCSLFYPIPRHPQRNSSGPRAQPPRCLAERLRYLDPAPSTRRILARGHLSHCGPRVDVPRGGFTRPGEQGARRGPVHVVEGGRIGVGCVLLGVS